MIRPEFRRLDAALIAAILLLALVAHILPGPRTIDDAFITFRYSRNIVEGQGFVYNPGSRVLGTTTPLYTLLMSAISKIVNGEDFQWYAVSVNALADAMTAVLLFLLARRLTGNRCVGALLGILWAIAPMSVTFAVGGMETSVSILCMVAAFWLYVVDQPIWMGVAAALGFLTRIDSLLWIGPLFLAQLIEYWMKPRTPGGSPFPSSWGKGSGLGGIMKRVPYRTWAAFLIGLLPWMVFSFLYFGSPLPNTIAAKTVAYVLPPLSALKQFIPVYATPFFEFDSFGAVGAMFGSVAYLMLSVLSIAYAAHRLPRLLPLLIYPWLYLIVFSAANPLIFRWYNVPPLPGLMLGIIAGAWAIIERLQRFRPKARLFAPLAMGVLAVLWVGMSLNAWTLHPDHAPDRPAPKMAWHLIELDYQQLAEQLVQQYGVTPQTRVASADIGTVGYFTRAYIIDTVGLVTPGFSKYYPFPKEMLVEGQNLVVPPQLILDTQPDYFVTMEAFVRLGLEKNATFKGEYGDPIITIPTDFYGTDMRAYRRRTD